MFGILCCAQRLSLQRELLSRQQRQGRVCFITGALEPRPVGRKQQEGRILGEEFEVFSHHSRSPILALYRGHRESHKYRHRVDFICDRTKADSQIKYDF